jgi:hypothetical protein
MFSPVHSRAISKNSLKQLKFKFLMMFSGFPPLPEKLATPPPPFMIAPMQLTGSCDHSNEVSASMKEGEYTEQ